MSADHTSKPIPAGIIPIPCVRTEDLPFDWRHTDKCYSCGEPVVVDSVASLISWQLQQRFRLPAVYSCFSCCKCWSDEGMPEWTKGETVAKG